MIKELNTRIQHKYDYEKAWQEKTSFVPYVGEMIVYASEVDAEGNALPDVLPEDRTDAIPYPRIKFGDGKTTISELEFLGGTGAGGSFPSNKLQVPVQKVELTFNETTQMPEWSNYDTKGLSITSGTLSAKNAGTYAVVFTPNTGYEWEDGTTTGKTVEWKINKATPTLIVHRDILVLKQNGIQDFYYTYKGDGEVNISEADTTNIVEITSVDFDAEKVQVKGLVIGETTIKINATEGPNYLGTAVIYLGVTVTDVMLENMTWDQISRRNATDFTVGDRKYIETKEVPSLSDSLGNTFSSRSFYLTVVDIDTEKNTIDFLMPSLTPSSRDCFISEYSDDEELSDITGSPGKLAFTMADGNGTDWRNTRIRRLLNILWEHCLPDTLKSVMIPYEYYAIDSGKETEFNNDYVVIPSVTEIFGEDGVSQIELSTTNNNPQKEYYKTGNNRIRNNCFYWLRDCCKNISSSYYAIDAYGYCTDMSIWFSLGVTPMIRVQCGKVAKVEKPTLNGSFTYNGSAKDARELLSYQENTLYFSGNYKMTNAGTYTFYITPANGYEWTDGGTEPYEVEWTIEKADVTLSVSLSGVTVTNPYNTVEVGQTFSYLISPSVTLNSTIYGSIDTFTLDYMEFSDTHDYNNSGYVEVYSPTNGYYTLNVIAKQAGGGRCSISVGCLNKANYNVTVDTVPFVYIVES